MKDADLVCITHQLNSNRNSEISIVYKGWKLGLAICYFQVFITKERTLNRQLKVKLNRWLLYKNYKELIKHFKCELKLLFGMMRAVFVLTNLTNHEGMNVIYVKHRSFAWRECWFFFLCLKIKLKVDERTCNQ